ncbi:hypothetical protein P7L78_06210 [Tistrella bauzanensis]|uniref:PAS domain-containing protein n=1 Tax=Tistrella TaxID=171436 RepID=UPI0031F6F353
MDRKIWGVMLAMLAVGGAAFQIVRIQDQRRQVIVETERQLLHDAAGLERTVQGVMQGVEASLTLASARLLAAGFPAMDAPAVVQILQRALSPGLVPTAIWVMDDQGQVRGGIGDAPPPALATADAPVFAVHHRARPMQPAYAQQLMRDGMFLTIAGTGGAGGTGDDWRVLAASRAIAIMEDETGGQNAAGRGIGFQGAGFKGVVVMMLSRDVLAGPLVTVAGPGRVALGLSDAGGRLLPLTALESPHRRRMAADAAAGATPADPVLGDPVLGDRGRADLVAADLVAADLVAERPVTGFPISVTVGRSRSQVLDGWRDRLMADAGMGLMLGLIGGAAIMLMVLPRRGGPPGTRQAAGGDDHLHALERGAASIWHFDADDRRIAVMPAIATVGAGRHDLDDLLNHLHQADRTALSTAIDDVMAGRDNTLEVVVTVPAAGGGVHFLRWLGGLAREPAATAGKDGPRPSIRHLVGVIHDITAQEVRHRETQERIRSLHEIQSLAGIASWSWPIGAARVWCAAELFQAFGIEMSADSGIDAPQFQAMVLPEDRPRVRDALSRARRGTPAPLDFRLLRVDGQIMHMVGAAAPGFDAAGRVVRINGALEVTRTARPAQSRAADGVV